MRRSARGHHVERDAGRADAETADSSVAPILFGNPFDGIVSILVLTPAVVQEYGIIDTFRIKPAAEVLYDAGVPALDGHCSGAGHSPFAVGSSNNDGGPRARA